MKKEVEDNGIFCRELSNNQLAFFKTGRESSLEVGRVMSDEVFVDSEVLLVFSDSDMHEGTCERSGTDGQ